LLVPIESAHSRDGGEKRGLLLLVGSSNHGSRRQFDTCLKDDDDVQTRRTQAWEEGVGGLARCHRFPSLHVSFLYFYFGTCNGDVGLVASVSSDL
jgi:hypothetical protein